MPSKGNLPTSSSVSKGDEKIFLGDVMKRRCFKCQGVGHLQVDCPNKKAIMCNTPFTPSNAKPVNEMFLT